MLAWPHKVPILKSKTIILHGPKHNFSVLLEILRGILKSKKRESSAIVSHTTNLLEVEEVV
jgi:hypothetical protein